MDATSRLSGLSPQVLAALQESVAASNRGDAGAAVRAARSALQSAPENAEVLRRLALALTMRGASDEAIDAIERAVAQRPDDAVLANAQAIVLRGNGRIDASIAALYRAHALQPNSVDIVYNLATALRDRGSDAEAVVLFEKVLALAPNHRDARAHLAWLLTRVGRSDEAATNYRHILQNNALDVRAWSALAELKDAPLSEEDLSTMRRIAESSRSIEDRVRSGFALGRAFQDRERYPEAFATYVRANALVRSIRRWDVRGHSEEIDGIIKVFPQLPEVADARRGEGIVFIVSLPRSGSTLTEQILSSHRDVSAGDERLDVLEVIAAEGQRRQMHFAKWAPTANASDWARLGDAYIGRIASLRGDARVFTDKLPSNWMWVGAIFAMLPGARIVDCRRDPVETGWSCFTQMFADGTQDFSYDFASIGAFWRDYDRSMRHWRFLADARIHTQVYESLLADAETQTRALLEFCNLDFDPACLRFYENTRSVRTISASQVRKPLSRSTARAEKYGSLLDPLRDALGIAHFKNPHGAI